MTNNEMWQTVLAELELNISKANFITWFKKTGIITFQAGQVLICVPNAFTKAWLEKKYHQEVIKSLERVSGKPIKKLEYKIENIKNVLEQEVFMNATENTVANEPIFSPEPAFSINSQPYYNPPMAGLFLTLNTVLIIL